MFALYKKKGIPEFPKFKKISIDDKTDIETIVHAFPPYSDFDFASLWSWDIKGQMEISKLNNNLVIKFTDYITGEPFFTYLGNNNGNDTAQQLLTLSKKKDYEERLKLIPEISAKGLDPTLFDISEDRDNFDYIYLIHRHHAYEGSELKIPRNLLSSFLRRYPHHKTVILDLHNPTVRADIDNLYSRWEKNNGFSIPNEMQALERFLDAIEHFSAVAVGVTIDNVLVAFNINLRLPHKYSNCLFAKADTNYYGIYSFLMHTSAKKLHELGYEHLNYEQDLGIFNLRKSKLSFCPAHFLKKYIIRPKQFATKLVTP